VVGLQNFFLSKLPCFLEVCGGEIDLFTGKRLLTGLCSLIAGKFTLH